MTESKKERGGGGEREREIKYLAIFLCIRPGEKGVEHNDGLIQIPNKDSL